MQIRRLRDNVKEAVGTGFEEQREREFISVHPPSTLVRMYECVCLNTYTLQVLSPFRGFSWNNFVQQLVLRTDCLSWCSVQAH
jgi:hypothetical protein